LLLLLLLLLLQAQRLSWHPSIALWCGNNEIDLSYEWSNSTVLRSNRNMFVVDYQAVFIDTVRKNIKQVRVQEMLLLLLLLAKVCDA
jgi:beta-galactosidase/beta-glucuronidase